MTPGPAELDDVPRTALDDELERILASGAVRSLYQPIVDLATGEHVGVEALARGPAGSALERPDALFDRRFDFVLTYDRGLVVGVAACLMSRIAAA